MKKYIEKWAIRGFLVYAISTGLLHSFSWGSNTQFDMRGESGESRRGNHSRTGEIRLANSTGIPSHPELLSRLSCGCLDSKGKLARFEVEIHTAVAETATGWRYRYVVRNNRRKPVRLIVFFVRNDQVQFATSFISDKAKDPAVAHAKGPVVITVPGHSFRSFEILDKRPPVEIRANANIIDRHGAIYGGGSLSLYFPQWPYLFGQ